MYEEGEEVSLTTNVRLIAIWLPIELEITKTVSGLDATAFKNSTATYTMTLQKQNDDGTWSDVTDETGEGNAAVTVMIYVTGNGTASVTLKGTEYYDEDGRRLASDSVTKSGVTITPGTYQVVESPSSQGNRTAGTGNDAVTNYFYSVTYGDDAKVTSDNVTSGTTSYSLTVTNTYSVDEPENTSNWVVTKILSKVNGEEYTDGKVEVGDVLEYTITVKNTGNTTLTLTVEDVMTGERVVTWGSALSDIVEENTEDNTLTITNLEPDGYVEITATYKVVPDDAGKALKNSVEVSDTDGDDKKVDDEEVTVKESGISITKTAFVDGKELGEGDTVDVGDTITYTLTVTNTGESNLSVVRVSDSMWVEGKVDTIVVNESDVSLGDTAYIWYAVSEDAALPSGESLTCTYTYTVKEGDTIIENTAVVTTTEDGPNDEDTTSTKVADYGLTLDKELTYVDGKSYTGGSVSVGDVLTYTITVINNGNTSLTEVLIKDKMMTSEPDVTVTDGDGTNVEVPTSWVWTSGAYNIDTIAQGVTVAITYTYTVTTADAGGTLTNTAEATTGGDGPGDSDTVEVPVDTVRRRISVSSGGRSTTREREEPENLNTEDHISYIIGYPEDYRTGQPTDDESLWPVDPEGYITRAEVATIFFRLLTDDAREEYWSKTSPYSDVTGDDWYNNAISTLANMGILDGYADGTFRPDNAITRAEFVKIAVSFFEYADRNFTYAGQYSDVGDGQWYAEFVTAATELGLIEGYPDGTFRPNASITRAEACTIVNRTLGRAPHEDYLLPEDEMITWPDNADTTEWYYADMQEATNSHDYTWITEDGETVEEWTAKLDERDWAALERTWSTAYSAPGEEVMDSVA